MNTELTTPGGTLAAIEREIERDPRLKSQHTKRGYKRDLATFEEWRARRPVTKLLVEEYAAHLQAEGKSPSTINRVLSAIRWWARKLEDLAYEQPMDKKQREEIATQAARVASIRGVAREDQDAEPTGRHIELGELRALMDACANDPTPAGVRDAAILSVAWNTGLRRFELAGLELADVEWTGEDEATLTIHGKRGKTRPAYVFNGAGDALRDWLVVRGDEPGSLFYGVDKAGNVIKEERRYGRKGYKDESYAAGPGVSTEALAQMLEKRRQQAEVKPLTWHDFRRTFGGNLLDNGADLVTVQKLMGHVSPTTTARYDRRPERARRRAAASLHVPYRRRDDP